MGVFMDIHAVMKSLSMERSIFHLESDFQFALAWEIQRQYPDCKIRLEVPFSFDKKGRIDIVVRTIDGVIPIEIKYLKKTLTCRIDGEDFMLAEGVNDMDMYSCMNDIERMESYSGHLPGFAEGYVLWLTNNPAYWERDFSERASYYKAFHAPDGSEKSGKMYFEAINPRTGKAPQIYGVKGYKEAIILNGSYPIKWEDYSNLGIPKGIFKYAAIRVPSNIE
jgi:hypothetical protein